jgi:hypothetical protein
MTLKRADKQKVSRGPVYIAWMLFVIFWLLVLSCLRTSFIIFLVRICNDDDMTTQAFCFDHLYPGHLSYLIILVSHVAFRASSKVILSLSFPYYLVVCMSICHYGPIVSVHRSHTCKWCILENRSSGNADGEDIFTVPRIIWW